MSSSYSLLESSKEMSAVKYCKEYNDPKADIILKSNDSVLFRIPSYVLKTHSSVFLDMFGSSPVDPNDAARKPIDIDADWTSLMLFLDLMIKPTVFHVSGVNNPSAILHLCDTFDCKIVIDRFMPCLMIKAKDDPWTMFCIADRYKRIDLAREAIKGMGGNTAQVSPHQRSRMMRPMAGRITFDSITLKKGKELSTEYLLGLLQILRIDSDNYEEKASKFQPAE